MAIIEAQDNQTKINNPKGKRKVAKRNFIYWGQLEELGFITPIEDEIKVIDAAVENFALTAGRIPYFIIKPYHLSEDSHLVAIALQYLLNTKEDITEKQWKSYVETYLSLSKMVDNKIVDGAKNVRFYDETDGWSINMKSVAEKIVEFMVKQKIKVPYLNSNGPSYKIAANIAVIHTGSKLKEQEGNDAKEINSKPD